MAVNFGQIERPVLAPHLEYRCIGDGQTLLVSETFNTLLHGQVYEDLLPLLDGRRSRESIFDALEGAHRETDVRKALAFLESRGYIVSGDHGMERGKAAFWSSQGVSPRRVEERLQEAMVVIHGDDGSLETVLETMGIAVDTDRPSLSVYVASDYLDDEFTAVNREHLESAAPWALIRPAGIQPLFGPVFRPAEKGPCWACLTYRIRNHQEVHSFLRNHGGEASAFRPNVAEPLMLEVVYRAVAMEIAKVVGPRGCSAVA